MATFSEGQDAARRLLDGPQRYTCLVGGTRSGKNRHIAPLEVAMTVVTTVTSRQLEAARIFVDGGYAQGGAAGLVGNFVQECGPNLNAVVDRLHPDWSGGLPLPERSGGIAEWLGLRKEALNAFAAAKGADVNDLALQCRFVMHELQTDPRYSKLDAQLRDPTRDVANLALNVCDVYERPNAAAADWAGRVAYARAVFAALAGSTPPAPAAPRAPHPAVAPGAVAAGGAAAAGVAYAQHGPNVVSHAVLAATAGLAAVYLVAVLARRLTARGTPSAQEALKAAVKNYRAASAALAAARAVVAAEVAEAQSLLSQM